MNREEVINFANDNPICYMASIENGKPHARVMKLWHADHTGFYFEILSPKITRELHVNPSVELCFFYYPKDYKDGKEMRVAGEVEFVTNDSILKRAKHAKQYLENLGNKTTEPFISVSKIAQGEAKFWDLKSYILPEWVENHMVF